MRDLEPSDLAARSAIREVLARYARGVDRCDWQLVRSCYHPDATDDHGVYRGDVDGFITYFAEQVHEFESTTHHVLQSVMELAGDVAGVETSSIAHHLGADAEGRFDLVTAVRYVDRFERRSGDWRIAQRVVVMEWVRTDRPGDPWPARERFAVPARDERDPSYRLFARSA
jgi:hypothetical protein